MICASIPNFYFFILKQKNADRSMKTSRIKYECRSRHKHTSLLDQCVHVCVNVQARGWYQVSFLYCSLPWLLFFETRSLWTWCSWIQQDCLASELKETFVLPAPLPPCWGSGIHCYAWFFHVGSRYPNSGPQACAVVTLPTSPPQPRCIYFH